MEYISPSEAGKQLDVHVNLIYKEIAARRIPAIRIGAPGSKRPVLRIPLTEFRQWVTAQLTQDQQAQK